ncbi:exodeoxyribonuclease VII large subunit [Candidatus Pyrohabitans sp.]
MRDSEVISLSLAASTLGLLLLFFAASISEPRELDIGELSGDYLGAQVKIEGEVMKLRYHEAGHIFLRVSDGTGEVAVPLFKGVAEKVDRSCLKKGAKIVLTGRVEEYRGELEVIPREGDDIRCLR